MKTSFYTQEELKEIGFAAVGRDVLVSRKCSIYGAEKMTLGDNVRIDDFCILSGTVEIGSCVHVSAYTALYGAAGIKIGNFCNMSLRVSLFSACDSVDGECLISPLVPKEMTCIKSAPIVLNDFVAVCTDTTVFPGVVFAEGSVLGACSLLTKSTEPWTIYTGTPAKFYKKRSDHMKSLAEELRKKAGK